MHPKDYRAQYAEGLDRDRAARSAEPASRGARELVKIIRDASADGGGPVGSDPRGQQLRPAEQAQRDQGLAARAEHPGGTRPISGWPR